MRSVDSFVTNKGMGRGSSWSSLGERRVVGQVGGCHRRLARGWPNNNVCQRVAAIRRGDPPPRNVGGVEQRVTPKLFDEMHEFIEEEYGQNSVKIVSNSFAWCRTSSRKALRLLRLRPLVIRTLRHLQARSLPRVVPTRPRIVGFMGVSRRAGEPNGRHDATRSHHQDPREDHW